MRVVGRMAIGQAPQAVVYVPRAVPADAAPAANLAPLGLAADTVTLTLGAGALGAGDRTLTTVALFDQGLTQVVQAVVSGLEPGRSYALALAEQRDGGGTRETIARFAANPAGAAVVDAVGPIRQIVHGEAAVPRRYLAIFTVAADGTLEAPVQIERAGS
jgi:hypothetical protein